MGYVGKNEEIFWQTIYDFQPYAMSIHHKDLVRKRMQSTKVLILKNDNYTAVHHNRLIKH